MTKPDLTFSSSSEIKSFVRSNIGSGMTSAEISGISSGFQLKRRISGNMFDTQGRNISDQETLFRITSVSAFNYLFNPLYYNGSFIGEVKDAYKTNELGFFIGLCFVGVFGWSFLSYRRHSLIVQKKRFIF